MMTIKNHIPSTKPTNGTLANMAAAIEGIPDFLKVANRPATPPPAPAPIKAPPVASSQKATVAKATPGKRANGIPKAGKEASPQVAKAKAGVKLATKAAKAEIKRNTSKPGSSGRYDWNGAEEAAKAGKVPPTPDFSADTHKAFRAKLAEVVAMVKAKDMKGLEAYRIKTYSSSPTAIDRYRRTAIIALKAGAKK